MTRVAGLLRDDRGTAIIEFAIVGSAFLALLFGTLQIALVFFAQQSLETAAFHFTREACWAQAETFSAELFRSRFSNFVDDQMALHRAACETRPRIVPRLEAVG